MLEGINLSERNVAGVVHWAFGAEVSMGPDKAADWAPETTEVFARSITLPRGHSMHNHNMLPTFQVRIRDLDQWVTLIEHGGLTALDDVYVQGARVALWQSGGDPAPRLHHRRFPASTRPEATMNTRGIPAPIWTKWAQSIETGHLSVFQAVRCRRRRLDQA